MEHGRVAGVSALEPPLFSVIVPFLDEERWLPLCLESLRRQTIDPESFELVFVDNGSSDRSADVVRSYGDIVLLTEPRRDPYVARNRGITAARGRYLAFLDADCTAHPEWLAELWSEIRGSDASIVVGYLGYPSPRSAALRLFETYENLKLRHVFAHGLADFYFGHAGNMVVKADVFAELGPFHPLPVVGDSEIIHRVIGKHPGAVVCYAQLAQVEHAEIARLRDCLRKAFEAGAHSETLMRVSPYRTLPFSERWRILVACAREQRYRPRDLLILVGTLLAGWAAFVAGRTVRASRILREGGRARSLPAENRR